MTNEEQTALEEIVRERDDLRLEVDQLKTEIEDLAEKDCVSCDEKDAEIEELEALIEENSTAPCDDDFHYIAQYGPSGGIGECRYCGASDDGTIINYATLDPMSHPLPAPMRKHHGKQLMLPPELRT